MMTSPLLPTDLEFDAIRDRLLAQVEAHEALPFVPHLVTPKQRRPRKPLRRVWVAVGSAAIAGALAIALVVTGGFGISGGIASAQAASVLHQASASAFAASDPAVAAGQYLKFETHESANAYIETGGHFTYSQTWTIYQPGTATDDWVLVRATQAPSDPVGGAATRAAMKDWKPAAAQNGVWTGKNGHIAGWASDESTIETLPRTDAAVHAFLYDPKNQPGGTWSADQEAWGRAVQMLTDTYVPADLRGHLFEAMTQIPGVTVTQNQATIDGRTGVAIGLASAHGEGQEIIIDPNTGEYLGYQEAGDVTSVTVSVVDAAPTN
jgi:hypothetical protein